MMTKLNMRDDDRRPCLALGPGRRRSLVEAGAALGRAQLGTQSDVDALVTDVKLKAQLALY
jgi:hypothetical protein